MTQEDIPKEYREIFGETTGMRLNTMIHNVIINSMDKPYITMSKDIEKATAGLRKFMFEHVYLNPKAKSEEVKAVDMIKNLYEYYICHMDKLPEKYLQRISEGKSTKEQNVCDFIAGMTDAYAVKMFQEFFIPESWKN